MFRQLNDILHDAFPEIYPRPQVAKPRKMIYYPAGLMTQYRVEKMKKQANDCQLHGEHKILSDMMRDIIMPMRWNTMDIEFGVAK